MNAGSFLRIDTRRPIGLVASVVWCLAAFSNVHVGLAQLTPNQVLVLYNSQGVDSSGSGQSDSLDVFQYYQSSRPGVLGFDIDDSSVTAGQISYTDYANKIRNPLRDHLSTNSLEQQVIVFTTTKGLPHRILDINSPNIGDQPSNATTALADGNITYATVDSELTLLWQPLEQNEANGSLDSFADNVVFNPYHNSTRTITSFNRSRITQTKDFEDLGNAAWRLEETASGRTSDAGNVYLTTRLDGHTVNDVQGMIDRGRYPSYNQFQDLLLFDENQEGDLDNMPLFGANTVGHLGDDYDDAAAEFSPIYDKVLLNEDSKFLIGTQPFAGSANTEIVSDSIGLLSSYGGNHGGDATGYIQSFAGQLSNGAIMNTLESYNAKQLGGVGGFSDQGQLADFIATGGTFGIGQGWEPFAFSLADNEVFLDSFLLNNRSWAEAAWSSIPWLSWQQVVVGDPLSTATLILDPQPILWSGSAASGTPGDGTTWSDANNWIRNAATDVAFQHGDTVSFSGSASGTINLDGPKIVESLAFSNNYFLQGDDLAIRSGEITVTSTVTSTIDSNIYSSVPLLKLGSGTLLITGNAPATVVQAGTVGGSGSVASLHVNTGGRVLAGTENSVETLTVGSYVQDPSGTLAIQLGANTSSVLEVNGTASLDGVIELVPTSQHNPPLTRGTTQTFTILEADLIAGGFDSIVYDDNLTTPVFSPAGNKLIGHVDDGLFQIVEFNAGSVTLTSYYALPGDANGDMLVNADDHTIWNLNKFRSGTSWLTGDFNNDGVTDVSDFNQWNHNFGLIAVPVAATVPEPNSFSLILFSLPLLTLVRRRRTR